MKRKSTILALCTVAAFVLLWIAYADQMGIRELPLEQLKTKYEKPDSRYLDVDGTLIHYTDQGDGPAIVALHGLVDSLHTWDEWVDLMGSQYRILRMDIPGFGLTGPRKDGDYSKEMFIRFLEKFLDRLDIRQCTLVGNSLGGAIAWNFALKHPNRVSRLVLIDPAGYPMQIPFPLTLAETPVIRHAARYITPRWIFRLSLKQVFGDPDRVTDPMIDRFYEMSLRPGNREALIAIMESLTRLNRDPAFSRSISKIKTPTLLLWGEPDHWIPVSHVSRWKQDVPSLDAIVYKGVGHVPQLEIPSKVAADIKNWFAKKEADKTAHKISGTHILVFLVGILLIFFLLFRFFRKTTQS